MTSPQKGKHPRVAFAGVITIMKPVPLPDLNNVLPDGSGGDPTSGFICAEGTATDDPGFGSPQQAFGMIIPNGSEAGDTIPDGATEGVVVNNNWCIKRGVAADIPDALCGGTGPTLNTLGIWIVYQGSPPFVQPATQPFNAVCADDTDCADEATCAPLGIPPAKRSTAASVLGTAPLQWAVTVTGFLGGAGAGFNGDWLLTLRQTADLHCVWDNGGDGNASPRIELCYDRPLPAELQLVFTHRSCTFRYTRPAAEWNWLNANILRAASANGGTVPDFLKVVPV